MFSLDNGADLAPRVCLHGSRPILYHNEHIDLRHNVRWICGGVYRSLLVNSSVYRARWKNAKQASVFANSNCIFGTLGLRCISTNIY